MERVTRYARWLLLAAASVFLAVYVTIALVRIQYPFALEWMEGGSVEHVERVLQGKSLYVPPGIEFVPYIYTPFYYYVSALPAWLFGSTFLPLRLVSFLSSLGIFALLFLLTRNETRNNLASYVAMGLFAASFAASGSWLDLARVDSLSLVLFLLGVFLLRNATRPKHYVVGGGVFALAFLSKQTALIMMAPLVAYEIVIHWRRGLLLAISLSVFLVVSTVTLDVMTGGWFSYYVYYLPHLHKLVSEVWWRFWTHDMFMVMPVVWVIALPVVLIRKRITDSAWYLIAVFAGMVGASYFSRLHEGGWDNALLPAYCGSALIGGMGLHGLLKSLHTFRFARPPMLEIGVYLVFVVQFGLLVYDPAKQIPSAADRRAGEQLVEYIRSIEGEVYIPNHGYLAVQAGKQAFAQQMAVVDVRKAIEDTIGRSRLEREILEAVATQRFSAIIADSYPWYVPGQESAYRLAQEILPDQPDVFLPVTGLKTRPRLVSVPLRTARRLRPPASRP